jgi:nicotinate-nucleotide adenylyltransferase
VGTSAPEHRLAMTRLLAGHDARISVDSIEIDRGGLSFTVDTMRAYRAARPDTELHLVLGDDAARLLPQWRETVALASLVRLVVLTREGGPAGPDAPLPAGFQGQRLRSRRIDVSATEIRERVRAGLPVRGFVTDAVASYIADQRLYRTTDE